MKKQRLPILFVLIIGLAVVMALPVRDSAGVDTAVAAVVAQSNSGDVVTAEGRVEPQDFANLSLQIGGTVAEVLVSEGDSVAAGDPLLRLDTAELEVALAQAQARVAAAEAGVTAANDRLAQAQVGVSSAAIQVEAAEAQLALTESGPLPEEIAAVEAAFAAAGASVAQAAANRDVALDVTTESQIQQAEADLAQATAELRQLEEAYQDILDTCFDTPDGEVCPLYGPVEETTRAQLETARLNQAAAQATVDVLRAGPTAGQQQAANGGVALALANRDAAQARLDLLLAGATEAQVRVAETAVQQAEAGVAVAEANVVLAETAVAQAEAGLAVAQAGLDAAEARVQRGTLSAPFAGTISRINVNPGELVTGGGPIVVLADFGGWLVRTTDLTELDIAKVTSGAPVSIRVDAIPDELINGTVSNIALVASQSRGDIVYEVEILLEERPDLPLRWGMTAFVDIDS